MAVKARPHHCRLPTSKPKRRSAITAMSTTPPESTTCTTDSGTSEMAATWRAQAPPPTIMPIENQREEYSALADRSGWRTSTAGASQAPRCLKKKLRFEATAHRSASRMPS